MRIKRNILRRTFFHIICWLMPLMVVLSFIACTKDGDTIYVDDDQTEDTRPIVYFIYKGGSLGDLSYVDNLWRGIAKATDDGNMLFSLAELPKDTAEMDLALSIFFECMLNMDSNRPTLVVLANDNLEPIVHRYESALAECPNVSVLLAESKDTTILCNTICLSGSGAYYQAGRVTARCLTDVDSIFIATANPTDQSIADMRKAFCRGIDDGETETGRVIGVDNFYVSNTSGGFDKADSIYRMSYDIDPKYQLVLPICGGTMQGFLRYNREHSSSFYTIGVDADMQQYSTRVPFSIVKHIDDAVEDWIGRWAKGETMERHLNYGLSSGYIELVVADRYKQVTGNAVEDLFQAAVEKEEEYEKTNN